MEFRPDLHLQLSSLSLWILPLHSLAFPPRTRCSFSLTHTFFCFKSQLFAPACRVLASTYSFLYLRLDCVVGFRVLPCLSIWPFPPCRFFLLKAGFFPLHTGSFGRFWFHARLYSLIFEDGNFLPSPKHRFHFL